MPILTTIDGKPVADFPDGTGQDVVQKVMKNIAAMVQPREKPYTPEQETGARPPLDPAGTMEKHDSAKKHRPFYSV